MTMYYLSVSLAPHWKSRQISKNVYKGQTLTGWRKYKISSRTTAC